MASISSHFLNTPSKLLQSIRKENAIEGSPTNIGFKVFIVFTVVISAIVVVAGVLALMAGQGNLPPGFEGGTSLSAIGNVNSYMMIAGGLTMFVLGVLAWGCHLSKEGRRGHI